MTSTEAKRVVLVAVVVAAAGTATGRLRSGGVVGPQLALAVALALTILTLMAEVTPQLAAGLATVMAMASWLAGPQAAEGLTQLATAAGERVRAPARTAPVPGTGGGTRQQIPT